MLSNRIATELPQQRTLNYLYYGSGHLHQINLDGDVISDIERDAVHREIVRSQGALQSHYQRDVLGRRTAQRAFYGTESGIWGKVSPASSFPAAGDATMRRMARPQDGDVVLKGYRYDLAGELEQRIDPLQGERRYHYDQLGRIASAHTDAANDPGHIENPPEQFAWDPASNLLPDIGSDKLWNNRIHVHQDKRYEYDTKGRLINKKIGRHTEIRLVWNDEDQLIASHSTRNGTTQSTAYDYDALGRRIAKHDAFGSTWFNWEGMRLLQEERGSVVATHIYEPGSYAPLARIDLQPDLLAGAQDPDNPPPVNTNVYYFHTNINGAPEEMTNRQGTLVWRARYAVWGNTVAEEWHPQHRPNTSGLSATKPLPQNLRMQGQYYDAETGLCYNTFRYYDADVGRFISQDPIGLAGGMNLYHFAPNPISWIDPWGWSCTSPKKINLKRAGVRHVKDRHVGNKSGWEDKSKWTENNASWKNIARKVFRNPDRIVKEGDRYIYEKDVGKNVGIDPDGEALTKVRVVTESNEDLVTAFPQSVFKELGPGSTIIF